MRFRKAFITVASLVFSAFVLTACDDRTSESDSKEETAAERLKHAALSNNSMELYKDFKFVGNKDSGYLQVPEEFKRFVEMAINSESSLAYSHRDETMKVSFQALESPDLQVEVDSTLKVMQEKKNADEHSIVNVDDIEVAGLKGKVIHKEYYSEWADMDYHVYMIFLNGKYSLKSISFEFEGDQYELKDKILASYSEDSYAVVSNDTAEMYNDEANGNGEVLATYESDDQKLVAGILSTNLQITKFEEDNVTLKIMGDFNEENDYFVTLVKADTLDYMGGSYVKAKTDKDGSYLLADIPISGQVFITGVQYRITVSNTNDFEAPSVDYFFRVDKGESADANASVATDKE
ncbi:hypothetical protein [Solibacillus sp. NPDC093137]|uniref:hypothetical protein n=1 Tax=Solibacillus sp. NPDC093137 TaxID=3390678 RepID=UPI003D05A381